MRLLLTILVLISIGTANAATLSPDAFTKEFAETIRTHVEGAEVVIRAEKEIYIKKADGLELNFFLDNAYSAYVADPESKGEIVERYIASLLDAGEPPPAERSRVVPIVKDRGWLKETVRATARVGGKGVEYVWEPLNDDLVIVYALDTPESVQYISPRMLEELELDRSQLRALAVENLAALLPKVELREYPLLQRIVADGNYDASLLLFDSLWSGGSIKVDGEIVVAVPARNALFVAGSNDKNALRELRELARDVVREGNYTLTDRLFVYRKGKFERF